MNDQIWKNVIIKASGAIDGGAEGKRRMALLMSWLLLGNKISEDKKSAVRKAYNDGHGVDISANPDAEVELPEALKIEMKIMRKEISYEFKVKRGILVGGIVDLLKVSTLPLNPLVYSSVLTLNN